MKMVKCFDCNKELKFIDAHPLWNRFDREPDFLCSSCAKDIPRCDDELELVKIISNKFINDNRPERLNPEDRPVASDKPICDSLNSMET